MFYDRLVKDVKARRLAGVERVYRQNTAEGCPAAVLKSGLLVVCRIDGDWLKIRVGGRNRRVKLTGDTVLKVVKTIAAEQSSGLPL